MKPSPGATVYADNGIAYRLSHELGRGAEGSVWTLDNDSTLVIKFAFGGLDSEKVGKLAAMCRIGNSNISAVASWPVSLIRGTRRGDPVGHLMKKIPASHAVHQLYGIKSRLKLFPEAQLPFLLHAAINTARAFATIHNNGQVIGDVNHSNLMISQNATVSLIDCDSFEIVEQGKRFSCGVGVGEFTPPELQGANFSAQARTSQHDAFGLSVLIFYLLFLGRHPFMGMYDPARDEMLSLEQAIGRYAFPYSYDLNSPEVKLPSFVPRLSDYPAPISSLFKQAFTREVAVHGRPSASSWVDTLTSLSKSLRQCRGNPNHHHFNGLQSCPWCRVEGMIGTPIFGIKISIKSDGTGFNLLMVWNEIELIKAVPDPIALPDVLQIQTSFTPDPTLSGLAASRRLYRLIALAVTILSAIIAFKILPSLGAISVIVASLFVSKKLWKKGSSFVSQFYETQKFVNAGYSTTKSSFDALSYTPKEFGDERQKLERAKAEYQSLEPEKAKHLAQLQSARERKQRQRFLEKFRIEDETISGIGPKFKALLKLWNIEDAWDVDAVVISQIKGFGPVKVSTLVAWRQSKEKMFRFDSSQPIDPRDILAIEQQFAQKRQALQITLRSGPEALRQRTRIWQAQRRQVAARLHELGRELAQANVNREALNGL